MSGKGPEATNKIQEPREIDPLMEAYNPEPLLVKKPAHFYWEEPCQDGSPDDCVQKTFES